MSQSDVNHRAQAILDFWFEGVEDSTTFDARRPPFKKWFIEDEKTDREIRRLFESDLQKAADGKYKGWEQSAAGRLALIILYDQFSRNMYRDTQRMYATDALAVELSLRTIREGRQDDYPLIQRVFLYMPLMHMEDTHIQRSSVDCFQKLVDDSKVKCPANTHYFANNLKYAQEHYDTVLKYGRFPHRDPILRRVK